MRKDIGKMGIFGLGYVGLTTAACLIQKGHSVVGYEVSVQKLRLLRDSQIPITEPGVAETLGQAINSGIFEFEEQPKPGTLPCISFICVGTPSLPDGTSDLTALHAVLLQLEGCLQVNPQPVSKPEIVIRSTLPPGTMEILAQRYTTLFKNALVCVYPEFLREGCAIHDFFHPPQTLLGIVPGYSEPPLLLKLLHDFSFQVDCVQAGVAEMVKAASNVFHSIKVTFANEVGRLAQANHIDGTTVMKLLIRDTKLNISPTYLLPGAPYGGSCLPKETRMMARLGQKMGLGTDLFSACESSNKAHLDYIASQILQLKPRCVAVLGLAFKADTDDLRESPSLSLIELLIRHHQLNVRAHDHLARPDQLVGMNKRVFESQGLNPHFFFSSNLTETLQGTDLVVIMQKQPEYQEILSRLNKPCVDCSSWIFNL